MVQRLFARFIMILSVACGVGSLALLIGFPLGSFGIARMHWPEFGVRCWERVVMPRVLFLQHSGMVRPGSSATAFGYRSAVLSRRRL